MKKKKIYRKEMKELEQVFCEPIVHSNREASSLEFGQSMFYDYLKYGEYYEWMVHHYDENIRPQKRVLKCKLPPKPRDFAVESLEAMPFKTFEVSSKFKKKGRF